MPRNVRAGQFGARFVTVLLPAIALGACASQQPSYEQARVSADKRQQSALGNNPHAAPRARTIYDDVPEEQDASSAQRTGQPKYRWNGNPERETFDPGYEAAPPPADYDADDGSTARKQAQQRDGASYRAPESGQPSSRS